MGNKLPSLVDLNYSSPRFIQFKPVEYKLVLSYVKSDKILLLNLSFGCAMTLPFVFFCNLRYDSLETVDVNHFD